MTLAGLGACGSAHQNRGLSFSGAKKPLTFWLTLACEIRCFLEGPSSRQAPALGSCAMSVASHIPTTTCCNHVIRLDLGKPSRRTFKTHENASGKLRQGNSTKRSP